MIGAITAGLFSAGVTPATNSYESIATVTVGGGGSSFVEFTSIPQTYKHLQIRIMARTSRGVAADNVGLTFNGDGIGTTNYAAHILRGDGSSTGADGIPDFGFILAANVPGSSASANVFGVGVVDILDYTNTNKFRVTRSLTGFDNNGSGNIRFYSGLYRSSTTVSSIKLLAETGQTHTQYSQFALYGIKG